MNQALFVSALVSAILTLLVSLQALRTERRRGGNHLRWTRSRIRELQGDISQLVEEWTVVRDGPDDQRRVIFKTEVQGGIAKARRALDEMEADFDAQAAERARRERGLPPLAQNDESSHSSDTGAA